MAWTKVNDKLYQVTIDGKYVDIPVPYGKMEKIFQAFIGSGGLISNEGKVETDIVTLIHNFSNVANIVMSTYGPKGKVEVEGDCSDLSTAEVIEIFQIASDCLTVFIKAISAAQTNQAEEVAQEAEEKQKAKKIKG